MSEAKTKLKELTESIEEKNESKIIGNLEVLSGETELDNVKLIQNLLNFNNIHILKTTTELIAELAKAESNRKICTDEEIILNLLNLLEHENCDIVLNSIRALGNICYENEEACIKIEEVGTNKLLSILKDDFKRQNNALTTKTTGLLLNLFNMNDGLIRASLKDGILDILENLLLKYSKEFEQSETILIFLISIIHTMEHYLDEQNIPFTQNLFQILIKIFKQSKTPEISVPCLEIFHGQCEQEEMKTLLAKEGVCELLFDLIEEFGHEANDEDSRSVLKMACDFIVVILTGDDCMHMLYDGGNGKVYKNMITWLDSGDPDLLSTGILAIGNFARKDTHCIEMVKDGISRKLIDILKKYNTSTSLEHVKIQHALLSTLKNLVIPQENKAHILEEGLIEVIYPMIKIDHYLVVFKLLGTFRMVIDGQKNAAMDLISRKELIERLVYWGYNSDHLGVRGEVPRLLSWLIKQCHSFKYFKNLLDVPDSIKCIVEMISSNHAVMQNEAFYAITLLHISCSSSQSAVNDLNKLIKALIDADIGKNLNFVLTKYAEKMDKQTIENIARLLDQLCKSERIVVHLKETELIVPLVKLFDNASVCNVDMLMRVKTLVSD